MGRGLSRLQKKVLGLALEKRFVTAGEMIKEFWGLQSLGSKEPIYGSAHAALSRSLTRLWARGLVEYWRTLSHSKMGITLTGEGEALAKAIFAEDQ